LQKLNEKAKTTPMPETIFFQLFESETSTYTYIIGDTSRRTALIIDPVLEKVERDLQFLKELNLNLKWILETHVHADHVTGAAILRRQTGAKIGVAAVAGVSGVDLPLKDQDVVGEGAAELKVLATPGHTNACLSFYRPGMVFTGDALMIHAVGRTDFQEGSSDILFDSIHHQLFSLPDDTRVYPAHDYKGFTASTIGIEKIHNLRIGGGRSREEFATIMAGLNLPPPKKIKEAVPANLKLGEKNG
jgi:sulfur dioxygenase